MNRYYLFPGKLAAFKEETLISTILGSCVAVALYDPVAKVGGLNHYLLPEVLANEVPNPRYGSTAIPMLIEEVLRLGGSLDRLQAKIYGGGNVIAVSILGDGIGRRNVEIAEKILKEHGIRITEQNVGGESGRTLKVNTHTFDVIHNFSNDAAAGGETHVVDVSGFKPLQVAKSVKVLIVDDSATVRTLFTNIFQKSGLEVVGAAADAYQAREIIAAKKPDVITLDIEMPRMSGVMFLEKLMKFQPTPVVMVSSLGSTGEAAMRALELGAVEFVHKPSQFDPQVLKDLATTLVEKVRAAASVNVLKKLKEMPVPVVAENVVSLAAAGARRKSQQLKLTVLGGNAGSAPAIEKILEGLAVDTPPMVVSCSIITNFMESFFQKMKGKTKVNLVTAKDGDWLRMGNVYFIPAGHHGKIVASNNGPQIKLEKGAPVASQLPSTNVLFESAAQAYQGGVYAVLLAGFGMDGVQGLTAIQGKGGMTVVQHPNEAQFPYGPQKAIEVGVVEEILNSDDIAKHLMHYRNQAV
jgi:two-component system chemotaxis response regulator CheB